MQLDAWYQEKALKEPTATHGTMLIAVLVTRNHGGILLTDKCRVASVVGTGASPWPVDKGAKGDFRGSWAA